MITRAQVAGLALQKVFGEEPSYEYAPDYVRVYYQPDRLSKVQKKIESMSTAGKSDVRVDWVPMITPLAIKKSVPVVAGIVVVGIFLGRWSKA